MAGTLRIMGFRLVVNYRPRGDQENAIAELTRGVRDGEQHQVLLGVTGSGKTFTMAKVIEAVGHPALVLAHKRHWRRSSITNSNRSSRKMRWSISSATTITISRKPTFPRAMSTSRRRPRSMT